LLILPDTSNGLCHRKFPHRNTAAHQIVQSPHGAILSVQTQNLASQTLQSAQIIAIGATHRAATIVESSNPETAKRRNQKLDTRNGEAIET